VEYDTRMVREVLKRVEGTPQERALQVIQVRWESSFRAVV
jgi:hypothetical protein